MKHWFDLRADLYNKRKDYMLKKLKKECEILRNKVRFITAIITDQLVVNKVKRAVILSKLKDEGYTPMSEIEKILPQAKAATVIKEADEDGSERPEVEDDNVQIGEVSPKDYDYLLSMALWSLTEEKVAALEQQLKDKK